MLKLQLEIVADVCGAQMAKHSSSSFLFTPKGWGGGRGVGGCIGCPPVSSIAPSSLPLFWLKVQMAKLWSSSIGDEFNGISHFHSEDLRFKPGLCIASYSQTCV